MAETVEKPLRNGCFFVIKIFKKVLDKGEGLWYYSRARPNESEGNGRKRTLKTIQRETRKKFSEDSKEFEHESV